VEETEEDEDELSSLEEDEVEDELSSLDVVELVVSLDVEPVESAESVPEA
jgi:hypothetical protein